MPSERKSRNLAIILSGVGLGLAFSSIESMHYRAMWTIGNSTSSVNALVSMVLFAVCCAITGFVFANSRRGARLALPWMILCAVLGSVGLGMRMLGGTLGAGGILPLLAYSLPEFFCALMLSYGVTLFCADLGFCVRVFAIGTMVAGVCQLLISFLSQEIAAYVLVFAYAPISVVLWRWMRNVLRGELAGGVAGAGGVGGAGSASGTGAGASNATTGIIDNASDTTPDDRPVLLSRTATVIALVIIALTSFVIAAAFRQCLSSENSGLFSLAIQSSNGVGSLIAGAVFYVFATRIKIENFYGCILCILPTLTITALYAFTLAPGSWVGLSVMLLNAATTMLRLIVLLTPFVSSMYTKQAGLLGVALLLRRWSTLSATLVFSLLNVLQQQGANLTFVVIFALMILSAVYYLQTNKKGGTEVSEAARRVACAQVSSKFQLTSREEEVLFYLSKGRTARYLAETLSISETTTKTHITHIYRKLGIKSQQSLIDIVDHAMRK